MVMIQRTVLLQRDEKGYGLRVSGENPVFVESVKSDGAAYKAGVRSGDFIIKVNGAVVTNHNHREVVQMIQSCTNQVALTLRGSTNQSPNSTSNNLINLSNQSTLIQNDVASNTNSLPLNLASSTSTRIRPFNQSSSCLNNSQRHITPPLPANDSTLIEFEKSRLDTIKRMLGGEREFLNKLRKDEKYPNEKESEINNTLKRIRTLEEQLSANELNSNKNTVARYIVPLEASFANIQLNNQLNSSRTSSISSINHQLGLKQNSFNNGTNSSAAITARKHLSAENLHFFTHLPNADLDAHTKKSHSFGQYDHQHPINSLTINNSIDSVMNQSNSSKDSASFFSNSSFTNLNQTSTTTVTSSSIDQEFDISSLMMNNSRPNIDLLLDPKNVHLLLNFLHHLLQNKLDINPTLFYILTDLFKKVCENSKLTTLDSTNSSFQNHIRKWAFEIYSTFLFNDSPLRLNYDFMKDQTQLYELLSENFTSPTTLVNSIFDPYFERCKELINQQIDQFKKNLPLSNGLSSSGGTMVRKIPASVIVECLINDVPDLPHQVSMNASSASTLLAQITILVSYLLNNSTVSSQSIQAIAQLTCFTSILYHCFQNLLVSSDENANTLSKLIPVPVYLSFHQANTSQSNQLQHKRHKSLPASSSNNQNSSAIPYHLSSSSQPTGNHNPPSQQQTTTITSSSSLQPKTLATSANNQIFLKSGHVFSLLNTTKPNNNCSGCNQSIWAMFGWHCQLCLLSAHHWCLRSTAEEHHCPGPIDSVLDQSNDLNQNNINNLTHLSSGSSTRTKSKNTKSTGGRLFENILKTRAESLKHKKDDVNKCTRKKSDPSISSSSLFSDYPHSTTTTKFSTYSSSSSESDFDDYQFNQFEHSFSIFNDNNFNRDDQILIDSANDSKQQLSSTNSSFLAPRSTSSIQLTSERKKANKRQDIFNELISTERTYVKNLKILNDIFYRPIYNEQLLSPEQIEYVFSNHNKLYEIHSQIYQMLKIKKREMHKAIADQLQFPQQLSNVQIPFDHGVGQLLVQIFEGELGNRLEEAASVFCAKQTIGGDILRSKLKKDSKLASFLHEAEANKCCRRLQLKDMLASCFQRITKYPLLMENLMKETPDKESEEYKLIEKACKRSKSILHKVNECVKLAENKQKLLEILRKTERPFNEPLNNFDLSSKTLIYEGQLTFRVVKKNFEVLVLLCTDVVVLLLKEGDKYTLKNINKNICPIVEVKEVITRKNATDSRGFYLISNKQTLMYEFGAASETEKNNWIKQIDEAAVKSGGVRSGQVKLRDLTLRMDDDQQFKDENHEQILTNLIRDQDLLGKNDVGHDDGSEQEKEENGSSKARIDGTISYVKDEDINLSYNLKNLRLNQPATDLAYSSLPRSQRIIERIQMIETEIERLNNEKQQLLRELNEECDQDRYEDRG